MGVHVYGALPRLNVAAAAATQLRRRFRLDDVAGDGPDDARMVAAKSNVYRSGSAGASTPSHMPSWIRSATTDKASAAVNSRGAASLRGFVANINSSTAGLRLANATQAVIVRRSR